MTGKNIEHVIQKVYSLLVSILKMALLCITFLQLHIPIQNQVDVDQVVEFVDRNSNLRNLRINLTDQVNIILCYT